MKILAILAIILLYSSVSVMLSLAGSFISINHITPFMLTIFVLGCVTQNIGHELLKYFKKLNS